ITIDRQFVRVLAVEVDVPGPRAPQLVVAGAEPKLTPYGMALDVHIANKGNAFAHGNGVIRVPDTNTDYSFKVNTFVSHTAIVYELVPWTKTAVPGTHPVQVDITYDGGRRATWSGQVVVSPSAVGDLASLKPQNGTHGGSFPWLLLLAALAAVFLIGGAILVRRRSEDRPMLVNLPVR
ncbi:MAG TPA: hypothetical protein VFR41_02160, partial [Acidimicrobiia bacterium]|nr:hypothetical protein [Acidimicrobiia bacterium]